MHLGRTWAFKIQFQAFFVCQVAKAEQFMHLHQKLILHEANGSQTN